MILSDTQSIADSPEAKAKREATAVDVIEHGTDKFVNDFITKALSPDASEKTKMYLKYILEQQDKMAIASAYVGWLCVMTHLIYLRIHRYPFLY